MDKVVLQAIRRLPFYNVPYKYPNVWGILSVPSPSNNQDDDENEQIPVSQEQQKNFNFVKEYFGFIVASIPASVLIANTVFALGRQLLSKKVNRDPELTFIAAVICIPAVVFGLGTWITEFAFSLRFREVQNVIIRLTEIHSRSQKERIPDPGKRSKTKTLATKLLSRVVDGYFANSFLLSIMVAMTPFFIHADTSYFLLKLFVSPSQKRSFWVSCIRCAVMVTSVHRWVITGAYLILYVIGCTYFFWSNFRTVAPIPVTEFYVTETERSVSKSVSVYKQLYLLMNCHNSTFRWVMAYLLLGTWIIIILNFTVSIWYKDLFFTKPMTYLVFPGVCIMMLLTAVFNLPMAGGVHKLSTNIIEAPLGFIRNRGYYKRLERGCRITGIQVGDFHFIDSNYLSNFLLSAMDQIVGLLMSFDINV